MNRVITVLLASCLLSAPALAAKDPCKGVQIKKDSFSAWRVFEAGELTLKQAAGNFTLLLGMNKGGGFGAFASTTLEQLAEGTPVEILFDDASVLTLNTTAAVGGQFVSIMGVSTTHYELPIALTVEQLQALTARPIKAYRVVAGGGDTWASGNVNKGDAGKFISTAQCMIANPPA